MYISMYVWRKSEKGSVLGSTKKGLVYIYIFKTVNKKLRKNIAIVFISREEGSADIKAKKVTAIYFLSGLFQQAGGGRAHNCGGGFLPPSDLFPWPDLVFFYFSLLALYMDLLSIGIRAFFVFVERRENNNNVVVVKMVGSYSLVFVCRLAFLPIFTHAHTIEYLKTFKKKKKKKIAAKGREK